MHSQVLRPEISLTKEPDVHAVLLLTVPLATPESPIDSPLNVNEWNAVAQWLKQSGLNPGDLLNPEGRAKLHDSNASSISTSRIERLLDQEVVLGSALEQWRRAGIWILPRLSDEYPHLLRHRIDNRSVPVIFGCGSSTWLFRSRSIAVVGSRIADSKELEKAFQIGVRAARQGYTVVSGGARGVDAAAIEGSLDAGGTAIVVLPHGLLSASTSRKYLKYIANGTMIAISIAQPEARFSVPRAMARNQYIYALADAAIVVCWLENIGGTWAGATESLRNKKMQIPIWINNSGDDNSGTSELTELGARLLPDQINSLSELCA